MRGEEQCSYGGFDVYKNITMDALNKELSIYVEVISSVYRVNAFFHYVDYLTSNTSVFFMFVLSSEMSDSIYGDDTLLKYVIHKCRQKSV